MSRGAWTRLRTEENNWCCWHLFDEGTARQMAVPTGSSGVAAEVAMKKGGPIASGTPPIHVFHPLW
jgi:hypothetical protein